MENEDIEDNTKNKNSMKIYMISNDGIIDLDTCEISEFFSGFMRRHMTIRDIDILLENDYL